MNYSIIKKYLSGTATENDVKNLFSWIEENPANRNEFIQLKKLWSLTEKSREDENKAWDMFSERNMISRRRVLNYSNLLRYAASVFVIFSLGMLLQYLIQNKQINNVQYASDTCIEVPPGQMTSVVLPDGSKVQMNSGSKLFYSGEYSAGERIVKLQGEAFFDIEKDTEHPFLVKTDRLDFKVYGTSFNVQAYPDEDEINTTLVEGSLGVINKKGDELTRLVPGENAKQLCSTNELIIKKVNTQIYTSWKEGLITFQNEKLKDIAKQLERWYNVKIIFRNPDIGEEVYLGTILQNKPIDQILEVFSLTSSLKYEIVPQADKPTIIYWE
ncbi:FecR family protein [Sunxiuqinia sp. A32]|uniref:FecR family protein n=1 Tax=Sunxiuqinia sp. A32 TaxID=3461496 RepID=UPI0040465EAC